MMRHVAAGGIAFTPYSVSPRWNDQMRGPKPRKNSVTFMPDALGGDEVAGLVQHDQAATIPTTIASVPTGTDAPTASTSTASTSEQRATPRPAARSRSTGFLERILHAAAPSFDGVAGTLARDAGLLRERRRRSSTFPVPCLQHLGDDLGDPEPRRSVPSRNASTATSLAPLSTAGAPSRRPGRPRRRGRGTGTPRRSGGSNVERPSVVQSIGAERLGRGGRARRARGRSGGACRASRAGRSVAPSVNSTMPCTIDCGWTTTSIRSKSTPNSSWASITSRPLFMSVDESIVILAPMFQVGCCERVGDGDALELGAGAAAERAAAGGEHDPRDLVAGARRAAPGTPPSARSRPARSRRRPRPGPWRRPGPPAIRLSLLASARRLPASSAARVAGRPGEARRPR